MERESSNERKSDGSRNSKVFEEVKRKNLMDWGEIELAESVQQNKTRRS